MFVRIANSEDTDQTASSSRLFEENCGIFLLSLSNPFLLWNICNRLNPVQNAVPHLSLICLHYKNTIKKSI